MVGAAITGGNVLIKNVIPKHLEPITAKLRRAGVEVEEYDDSVRVRRTGDILPLKINTMPHPGFPKMKEKFYIDAAAGVRQAPVGLL